MSVDPYNLQAAEPITPYRQEVGAAVTATPSVPEPKCPKCGYIVIGLSGSICPECGEVISWRTVVEEPEYRRLVRQVRWEKAWFWVGLSLYLGSLGAIAWRIPSAAGFFICTSPFLALTVPWLAYRIWNEDEIRGTLLVFGVLGTAYAVLCWLMT